MRPMASMIPVNMPLPHYSLPGSSPPMSCKVPEKRSTTVPTNRRVYALQV